MKAEKNSSPALTILFVAAVAALASIFSWFSSVDTAYYDFLLQKNLLEYPDDVVVIAVDETSIERLGAWPWDRRYHAHLLCCSCCHCCNEPVVRGLVKGALPLVASPLSPSLYHGGDKPVV